MFNKSFAAIVVAAATIAGCGQSHMISNVKAGDTPPESVIVRCDAVIPPGLNGGRPGGHVIGTLIKDANGALSMSNDAVERLPAVMQSTDDSADSLSVVQLASTQLGLEGRVTKIDYYGPAGARNSIFDSIQIMDLKDANNTHVAYAMSFFSFPSPCL